MDSLEKYLSQINAFIIMVNKIKLYFLCSIVCLGSLLNANTIPYEKVQVSPAFMDDDVCNLAAPAFITILDVGTTWAQVAWAPVSGAAQFHITTRAFPSGTILNDMYVSVAVTSATISPLPPGTSCRTEIRSVCQGGEESSGVTYSVVFGTPILDLVECGLWDTKGLAPSGCLLGTGPINGCGISNTNGVATVFRISDINDNSAQNFRYFRAFKTADGMVHIDPHPNTNGNISFEFENNQGGSIFVKVGSAKIAHFSTNGPNAAGQRKLFRLGDSNDDQTNYKIRKMNGPEYNGCIGGAEFGGGSGGNDRFQLPSKYDGISATPNPFTNFLDIKIPFTTEENDVKMSLYNLQGRLVLSVKTPGGAQMQSISTTDLQPGLYLLRVDTGEKSETIKVLKTQ